jgi:hypothetical protein
MEQQDQQALPVLTVTMVLLELLVRKVLPVQQVLMVLME